MRLVFIVPARGGSKGIARKNLAPFRGRPLIAHTLHALATLSLESNTIVSSEDDETLDFAEKAGFASQYRRPLHLGGDEVPMFDVVLDALDWWEEKAGEPDYVVLLQPTSPLRDADDIRAFVSRLEGDRPQSLISVHKSKETPMETVNVESDGSWQWVLAPTGSRRQDYTGLFFHVNGAIYAATPHFLRENRALMMPGRVTSLHEIHHSKGLDIDDPEDLLS